MWNATRVVVALVALSGLVLVLVDSHSSTSTSPKKEQYSRRIKPKSTSAANLRLQTLRNSRQTPSIPALYSAPKEEPEIPALYSAPKSRDPTPKDKKPDVPALYSAPKEDESGTTETVTEESVSADENEGVSEDYQYGVPATAAPVSENDVDTGTETPEEDAYGMKKTPDTKYGLPDMKYGAPQAQAQPLAEYGPPQPLRMAMRMRRPLDQQQIETMPFAHQIQIHVVPPHLSMSQGEDTEGFRGSYGVPMPLSQISQISEISQIGQYLPPVHTPPSNPEPVQMFQGQRSQFMGGYQSAPAQQRSQDQSPAQSYPPPQQQQQQPAQAPQQARYQPQPQQQQQPPSQEYETPPRRDEDENGIVISQDPTESGSQSPQQGYPEQSHSSPAQGYPEQASQGYSDQQSQGYSQPQQSPAQSQGYSQPQQAQAPSQGYSQPQAQSQGYPQAQAQSQGYSQPQQQPQGQRNQMEPQGNSQPQPQQSRGPQGYSGQPDFRNQQGPPLRAQQIYSQSIQPQPQQRQQPEQYLPSQQQQTQRQSGQYGSPPQQQQPQNFARNQILQQQYDQQSANSQPSQRQQGYSSPSRSQPQPQPQQNQQQFYSAPTSQRSQPQHDQDFQSHQPQSQQYSSPQQTQGQYLPPSGSGSQGEGRAISNSAAQEGTEELEGLNGRIVDAALLERVQQIIEEHERQQKALFNNIQSENEAAFRPEQGLSHNSLDSQREGTFPNMQYGIPPFTNFREGEQPQDFQTQKQIYHDVGNNIEGQRAQHQTQQYQQGQPGQQGQPQNEFQDSPQSRSEDSSLGGNGNGIQYQKAILSKHFIETDDPNQHQQAQQQQPAPQPQSHQQQQQFSQDNLGGYAQVGAGLRLVPAPHFGSSSTDDDATFFPPQNDNSVSSHPGFETPKPVYGVPLAPVIGLDSNENYRVVDDFNSPFPSQHQPEPQQFYGRNRRRVGIVTRLNTNPRNFF